MGLPGSLGDDYVMIYLKCISRFIVLNILTELNWMVLPEEMFLADRKSIFAMVHGPRSLGPSYIVSYI